ncbi:hypothetical protein Tco_0723473 [Tanacetum coccineum]
MMTLKFADTHNMVAFLSKPTESNGLEQIVNFLNAHSIRHALTINPIIYISCIEQFWSTVKAKTINGEVQLHALVDGKKIIVTGVSIRRDLQLADEEGGRINAIDADEDITLVNVQDDVDNEMFDMDALNGDEVFVVGKNENVVEEVVDAIDAVHQLAERLQAQEQEELSDAEKATLFQQLLEKRRKHFAAKRAEERRNKSPTKFDFIQEMFDRAFKRVNTFEDFRTKLVEGKEKRAGEELMHNMADDVMIKSIFNSVNVLLE